LGKKKTPIHHLPPKGRGREGKKKFSFQFPREGKGGRERLKEKASPHFERKEKKSRKKKKKIGCNL